VISTARLSLAGPMQSALSSARPDRHAKCHNLGSIVNGGRQMFAAF